MADISGVGFNPSTGTISKAGSGDTLIIDGNFKVLGTRDLAVFNSGSLV